MIFNSNYYTLSKQIERFRMFNECSYAEVVKIMYNAIKPVERDKITCGADLISYYCKLGKPHKLPFYEIEQEYGIETACAKDIHRMSEYLSDLIMLYNDTDFYKWLDGRFEEIKLVYKDINKLQNILQRYNISNNTNRAYYANDGYKFKVICILITLCGEVCISLSPDEVEKIADNVIYSKNDVEILSVS